MKKVIVYSCVTEDVGDLVTHLMRFSLSKDINSTPTKKAKRFKGRVAASFVNGFDFFNSCKSSVSPCTSSGDFMCEMSEGEMLEWLLGEKDIATEHDPDYGDEIPVLR